MRPLLRAFFFALYAAFLLTTPLASAPPRQTAPAALNAPLTSAFTYQGKLEKGNELVNATCSMTYSLFDASIGGTQIGSSQTINPVLVQAGLFTVALNGTGEFGSSAFDGNARFLEITVLCPGDVSAVTLPRQQLTAVPYAITALTSLNSLNSVNAQNSANAVNAQNAVNSANAQNALNAQNSVNAQNAVNAVNSLNAQHSANSLTSDNSLSTQALQGRPVSPSAPTSGQALAWDGNEWTPQTFDIAGPNDWSSLSGIPAGFADEVDDDSGGDITNVTAGNGLTGGGATGNVTLSLDTAVTDARYWQLDGNDNITATGFLGTRNNMTLTLGISNTTVLRLLSGTEPNDGGFSPTLIGGHPHNRIAEGVAGAIIAGGGRSFSDDRNVIFDSYGAILGGIDNRVGSDDNNASSHPFGVVGGGVGNRASGELTTVGGGLDNEASGKYAAILGGAGASASLHGQVAHAAGAFNATPGNAQTSIYLLRNEGTGNLSLFLDGEDDKLTLRPGTSMVYTVHIIGRSTSNVEFTAAYRIDGAIYANDAGATSNTVVVPIIAIVESNFSGDLSASTSAVDGTLQINVENSSGHAMRWVATVDATEVSEN